MSSILVDTTVEPQTKSWKDPQAAERLIAHIDAKIETLNKEKAKNQAKLDETNIREKQKNKITTSLKDLDSRLKELNASKADIDLLGKDSLHIYSFSGTGENCVIKKSENEITIQGMNDALLIHEIKHLALWLQSGRNFRFSKDHLLMPTFADGSVDELQSYRAQYAFEPNSLPYIIPTDIEHVNIEFIAKIQREDGTTAYPSIREMWLADLKIAEQQLKLKQATQGAYSTATSH